MAARARLSVCGKRRSAAAAVLSLVLLSAVVVGTFPPFSSRRWALWPEDWAPNASVVPSPSDGQGAGRRRGEVGGVATHTLILDRQRQRAGRKGSGDGKRPFAVNQLKHKSIPVAVKIKPSSATSHRFSPGHSAGKGDKVANAKASFLVSGKAPPPDTGTSDCRQKCGRAGPRPEVGHKTVRKDPATPKRRTLKRQRTQNTVDTERDPCQDFGEGRNQTQPEYVPWLSADDLRKMELLSGSVVLSKARVPGHGQVLQVVLDTGASARPDHSCHRGQCGLIKRPTDWYEVLAFHLDRVLGLNRTLPAVLRNFTGDLLPYRFTSGHARPLIWWDPDIRHLADKNNDQNSHSLTWTQYQAVLRSRCGVDRALNATPCVGLEHSEWGRLALFDFLLQVNDRLDRHCCGFQPEPSDLCMENLLRVKCSNSRNLGLVHILVRSSDPSCLVFIDNAGRPHQPHDNLDLRLLEGVDEFPDRAVSVLQSGCLEKLLLRSLSLDAELWRARGGAAGLKPFVRAIQQRGGVLLRHVRDRRLQLNRDL